MRSDEAIEPVSIQARTGSGVIDITWADDHESQYAAEYLRWHCPCATCRGEMGRPGLLDFATSLTSQQTQLVDVALVGQYALTTRWADGHDTGIYAFDSLRALCPCPACTAGRETTS